MITKEELLKKIEAIEDEALFDELAQLIDFHSKQEGIYIFSPEEMLQIAIAEKQIEEGNFKTHEEVVKLSQKWFNQ